MSWCSNATSSIICCSICCSNWIWFCSLKPCSNAVLFTPSQHDCEGRTDQPSSPLTSFRSLLIYQPPPPTKVGRSLPLGQLQLSFSCVTKKFLSSYPKNSSTSFQKRQFQQLFWFLSLNFLFICFSIPACSCVLLQQLRKPPHKSVDDTDGSWLTSLQSQGHSASLLWQLPKEKTSKN